ADPASSRVVAIYLLRYLADYVAVDPQIQTVDLPAYEFLFRNRMEWLDQVALVLVETAIFALHPNGCTTAMRAVTCDIALGDELLGRFTVGMLDSPFDEIPGL
ncbi:hypothetical protein QWU86_11335, partial [Neisseria gonorrhoeae]